MRMNLTRDFYIPKDYDSKQEQGKAVVYLYDNRTGRPAAVAFYGKAQKPAWHYWYNTPEQRQAKIDSWFKGMQDHEDFKQERKDKQREEISQHDIKPGQYFSTSWGYDQTNYDFLVVSRVTAATAYCRMADQINVGESGQSDVIMPGTPNGPLFRMRIVGKSDLSGSYPYCLPHGGTRSGHFSRINLGEVRYQTNPVFGH